MAPGKRTIKPKTSNVERMFRTHDPLAELSRAERAQEDDYFRQLDQELIVARREKDATEIEPAIRTYTRMRCPTCGEPLEETHEHRVKVDACPACDGIWLDREKWEVLVGSKESGWLQQFFKGAMGVKP